MIILILPFFFTFRQIEHLSVLHKCRITHAATATYPPHHAVSFLPPRLLHYDDSECWMKWPSCRLLLPFLKAGGVREKKKREQEGVSIFIENIFPLYTLWTIGRHEGSLFQWLCHLVSSLLIILPVAGLEVRQSPCICLHAFFASMYALVIIALCLWSSVSWAVPLIYCTCTAEPSSTVSVYVA